MLTLQVMWTSYCQHHSYIHSAEWRTVPTLCIPLW